ncbi:3',5'-cyclic AMP phosphodiesterase CpdA [Paenibacillus jilunlii]|uniref:3',5'-cyclic AMP phosphodiesterase CpdA n=2 Tax=Paenibacillus jilunlii TaxID=682956 RepID=A0A1G9H1U1_9BACL|nr:3',5'-cyclic AMP phosphodiesterase CpdA [Paenibacillus jilunlii]
MMRKPIVKGSFSLQKTNMYTITVLLAAGFILAGCRDTNLTIPDKTVSTVVQEEAETAPVSFWVATDTHYLDKELQDGGAAFQAYVNGGDGKILPYSDELMEALVYDAEQKKPEFLILSGDLTNNGETSSHKKLTEKLKRVEEAGTDVYVIPGNHDLNNPWARSFKGDKQIVAEHITPEDFTKMYADFGYSEALSRDNDSLSYLVNAAPGLYLLMIDSSQYANNESYGFPQTDGRILPSTLSWMDDCAKLAAGEHASIITVMHHNLLSHTSMSVAGFKLNNSQETMKTLRRNNLNLVLSGHIHMQDIARDPSSGNEGTAGSGESPVYDIATSAFAVNPHQYGAMTFDPVTRAITYHSTSVDVEGWSKANGITDPNLLNFTAYAESVFAGQSYNKAMARLKESTFSEREKQSMAEVMAKLNVNYFAGTASGALDEIRAMPGYKLWMGMDGGFMSGYIQSMAADKALSNVSLEMNLTKP